MSSSYRVSEFRSIIHSTISRLRSSFRASDFDEAEQKLLSMEEKVECSILNLREERDFFESELSGTRLEAVKLKADLSKFERELEISDGKLSDLERDLGVAREKEVSANKRYGKMCDKVRVIEGEKEKLIEETQKEQDLHAQKLMILNAELADLRRDLKVKEVENEDLRAKNGCLEKKIEGAKRVKDNHLEEMERTDRDKELEKKAVIMEMETREVRKKVLDIERRCVASWASGKKVLPNSDVEKIMCFALKLVDARGVGNPVVGMNVIVIESDDEDDEDLPLHGVKKRSPKKRAVRERQGSSEDSLNPKIKLKKLNDLHQEPFKLNDHKDDTSTVSTVRKCNQTSTEANTFTSPRVKDLLATCRRSRED